MATGNGVERAREAMRQAGRGWSTTPVVIKDAAAPEVVPFKVLRVEEPEQPVRAVQPAPAPKQLRASVMHDLLLAGFGMVAGFAVAFIVTYLRLGK
jgi:hypothetical protein